MSFRKAYAVDPALEESGAWAILDAEEGIKVKVRRWTSKIVTEERKRLESVVTGTANRPREKFTEEELTEINAKLCASVVVLDWEGVTDAADNLLPFNEKNGLLVYTDPGLKEFLGQTILASARRDTFSPVTKDVIVKNSQNTSSGAPDPLSETEK